MKKISESAQKRLLGVLVLLVGIAAGASVYFIDHPGLVRASLSGSKISFGNSEVINIAPPTASSSAASQQYVITAAGASVPTNWTCTIRTAAGGTFGSPVGVACSGSEKVVSGGCSYVTGNNYVPDYASRPGTTGGGGSQGWYCASTAISGSALTGDQMTAWANCCL